MAGGRKTVAVPAGSLSGLLLYTLQQFDRIDFTIRQLEFNDFLIAVLEKICYNGKNQLSEGEIMIPIYDILIRSMSGYVFMVPLFVLYFLWLKKSGRTQTFLHTAAVFVFGYYLFGLLTVTGIGFTSTMNFRPNISWTPFVGMITGPIDTILNVILFVPLGFFLPLLYKKYHNIKTVALTGFLFSLAVEFVQMFDWGSSDINDLMTNTTGACVGFMVYCLLSRILPANLKKQLQSRRVNAMVEVILFAVCTFGIMVTAQTWFVHDVLNVP